MDKNEVRREQARNLRYKRPALSLMGWNDIGDTLDEIREACDDITYSFGPDSILDAFDGDEEKAFEFQMAFSDLSNKCDQLTAALGEIDSIDDMEQYFNDRTVAIVGNRYGLVGYDGYEEDYFALTAYEAELAESEAGKRICRETKKEMLSGIGQCVGILLAFYDLRQQYDYLKAELDILRGENAAIIQAIKDIEKIYERQAELPEWQGDKEFNRLLSLLPESVWIG